MDAKVFRERFKELRKETGMRYEDVAKKTGIGLETVRSHCRSHSNMPRLDYLEAYSKLFNVDTAYLFGEQKCRNHHDNQTDSKLRRLLSLMCLNPELPIVPMVDSEIVAEDCGYWEGSWGNARIDHYLVSDYGILFKSEEDIFDALEKYKHLPKEEIPNFPETEEEARQYYEALPWKKAIIVYINLPTVE